VSLCPGKPCPFIPGRYSVTNVSCGGRQYVSRASDIGSTTRIEVPLPAGRTAVAATLIHFRPGRAAGPRPRMPPLPAGSGAPRVRFRVGLAMGRAPTWRPARARRESGLDADAPDARLADDAVQQFGVWQVDGLGLAIALPRHRLPGRRGHRRQHRAGAARRRDRRAPRNAPRAPGAASGRGGRAVVLQAGAVGAQGGAVLSSTRMLPATRAETRCCTRRRAWGHCDASLIVH